MLYGFTTFHNRFVTSSSSFLPAFPLQDKVPEAFIYSGNASNQLR
jgi:hypothetical protein